MHLAPPPFTLLLFFKPKGAIFEQEGRCTFIAPSSCHNDLHTYLLVSANRILEIHSHRVKRKCVFYKILLYHLFDSYIKVSQKPKTAQTLLRGPVQ